MAGLLHPLLLLVARATELELARYVEYLKAENRILRSRLPRQIVVTDAERQRLVELGSLTRWSLLVLAVLLGSLAPGTSHRALDLRRRLLPRMPPACPAEAHVPRYLRPRPGAVLGSPSPLPLLPRIASP